MVKRRLPCLVRTGFKNAERDVIVVMDANGQHGPRNIPRLAKPILADEVDMVAYARESLLSFSERAITRLHGLAVDIRDACSGFKALGSYLAKRMG